MITITSKVPTLRRVLQLHWVCPDGRAAIFVSQCRIDNKAELRCWIVDVVRLLGHEIPEGWDYAIVTSDSEWFWKDVSKTYNVPSGWRFDLGSNGFPQYFSSNARPDFPATM